MRDAGLEQAIKAAGGVASLARAVGIAQPSVSAWSRIPAERVLAVETLTSVPRFVLRPDLYGTSEDHVSSKSEVDEIDQLRAAEYDLLSLLLGKAPDAQYVGASCHAQGRWVRSRHRACRTAAAAAATDDGAISREFFDLFIGLGRGEVLPYASYYLTGFLHERPLARVRDDFDKLGIERAGPSREPEDHVAILLEVMSSLARGEFEADFANSSDSSSAISSRGRRGCSPISRCRNRPKFYRAVGRFGRIFMELESEAFTLSE